MFDTKPKEEAMLYYLYMMSDGTVSYSEEKLFDEICKGLKLDEDEKKSAIENCKGVAKNSQDALSVIFSEKIDEQIGYGWFAPKDKATLARVIWNLVNLGYADTRYSDEEKKVVNHLIKKWKIDEEVYQEMIDTADTMLALTKQKEWTVSTFPKGSERDEREKRIDAEIKTLLSDIRITVFEMTM